MFSMSSYYFCSPSYILVCFFVITRTILRKVRFLHNIQCLILKLVGDFMKHLERTGVGYVWHACLYTSFWPSEWIKMYLQSMICLFAMLNKPLQFNFLPFNNQDGLTFALEGNVQTVVNFFCCDLIFFTVTSSIENIDCKVWASC